MNWNPLRAGAALLASAMFAGAACAPSPSAPAPQAAPRTSVSAAYEAERIDDSVPLPPEPYAPQRYHYVDHPLPDHVRPIDDEFLVAVIPDTQAYTENYPRYLEWILQWLAAHAEDDGIAFVSHAGDIVEHGSDPQEWVDARIAYDHLDAAEVPYGLAIGNHDRNRDSVGCEGPYCASENFRAVFDPSLYEGEAWWGGSSPGGESSYQRVQVGGLDIIFMHIRVDLRRDEVAWAEQVIADNPDALVHITTHKYMFDYRLTAGMPIPLSLLTAGRFNLVEAFARGNEVGPDYWLPDDFFRDVVAKHRNIFMVHCGHVDSEYRQVSTNDAGLPVHEILIDFQNMIDGGGGWIRLLKFRPSANEIEVYTWSPILGRLRRNGEGLEHAVRILETAAEEFGDTLADFDLTEEDIEELLDHYRSEEGSDELREMLYGAGARDSEFVLSVDFDSYVEGGE